MRSLFFGLSLLLTSFYLSGDIYSIHITTINGADKSMEDFRGKKILIVVLPVTKTSADSMFLGAIDSISRNYSQNLSIIGVPSFEGGYKISDLDDLRSFYAGLMGTGVTITEGVYTGKGSGERQHKLFTWLTHKEKNVHFDLDIEGPGQKFFINERGELYGVVSPQVKLTSRVMLRMMQ